ncbi:hypothetical protein Hanom_Chr08g00706321 [Helianthus anomalus]
MPLNWELASPPFSVGELPLNWGKPIPNSHMVLHLLECSISFFIRQIPWNWFFCRRMRRV